MKTKKLFLPLIGLLFISQIIQAQLPAYVPSNGLVAWYPFNGNANDESGNGNNGNVNGATLTTDRNGVSNHSYNFNGSAEIRVPSSTSLESFTTAYTISAWVNINLFNSVGPGQFPIIDKNAPCPPSAGATPFLFNANNNNTGFDIQGINCGIQSTYGFSGSLPQTSQWTHVVAVYNGANIKIYVNDVLLNTIANSGTVLSSTGELSIGHSSFGCSCSWSNGSIDDIGIWNRELNQTEINNLYNGNVCSGVTTATITASGSTTFCAGLDVLLTATPANATYQWQKNGVDIVGATSQYYVANVTGNYTCVLCGSVTSNSLSLTRLQGWGPVTLSAGGSTTFCTGQSVTLNATNPGGAYTIQWYRQNISINGANSYSYTVTRPGDYKVIVTNPNTGCSRLSTNKITAVVNCRTENPNLISGNEDDYNTLQVYPNPTSGSFNVESIFSDESDGNATILIYDITGKQILNTTAPVAAGMLNTTLDFGSGFPNGVYLLKATFNGNEIETKVMLN